MGHETPGTEPMRLAPRTVQGRSWAEACGAAPGGRLAPKAGPRGGVGATAPVDRTPVTDVPARELYRRRVGA